MANYFEQTAVVDFIRSYRSSTDIAFHMEEHLQEIPAADVRPVVQCRDCAVPHNEWTGCPKLNGTLVCPEDFCSHGVNKEES